MQRITHIILHNYTVQIIFILFNSPCPPENFQVQRVITPYFWKWWVFAYFLCTLLYSLLQKRLLTCTLLKLCLTQVLFNKRRMQVKCICLIWHDCCKYFVFCSSTSAVFTAVLIMSSMIPLTILSLDTDETVRKYRIFRSALALSSALIHVLVHFQWTTCSQIYFRFSSYLLRKPHLFL